MRRGFSLFTPLVGTTVVVIATLMAVVMIQNDVRISRGLTASYEVSSQTIAAKLIKAAAEIQILENIKNNIYSYLESSHTFVCSDVNSCVDQASYDFTNPNGGIEARMRGFDGIYNGVIANIEIITNYQATPRVCPIAPVCGTDFDCCISEALKPSRTPSIIDSSFDGGKYKVKVDSASISANAGDAFTVGFQNKNNPSDRITLSIIPIGFSYITNDPIKTRIDNTANAFYNILTTSSYGVVVDDLKSKGARHVFAGDDGNDHKIISAGWPLIDGNSYNLGFQKDVHADYPKYCEYNSGVKRGSSC